MVKHFRIKEMMNNENNKMILNNIIGSFLIKGGSLVISLMTIPAYMRYFENQHILGLWFTILSILNWILTFDLGIGNGLRNKLVYAMVRKDELLAKKYISSAYIIIGILVIIVWVISIIIFKYINLNAIFNISSNVISNKTLNITIIITFSGIMLQFLLKIITSILYAMQRSAINNLLNLITSIIILIYVSTVTTADTSTNLILLAVVNVLAVNIPLLITTIMIFSTKLKECKPNIKYFGKQYAKDVMILGGAFFWIQFMYMIITTTNEYLITFLASTELVVEYQVYNKLFTLVGTLFTLALTPIWSAVTKAHSEGNYPWIKKLYNILKLMAILAIICEFAIIPLFQFIINLWLGDNAIRVNYLFAFIFAISGSIFVWNGVISSIANGIGKLKIQSVFLTVGAIIKIPIAWILVKTFDSWIGVIVANIFAMSFYCIIQPIWINRILNKK